MNNFKLAKQLKDDTHLLVDANDLLILLHKNASVPWIIIVPKTDVSEVYELPEPEQTSLNKLVKHISGYFKKELNIEKINYAVIGNVVSQLHIHVVGRKAGDACWPNVVWGREYQNIKYSNNQISAIKANLEKLFL